MERAEDDANDSRFLITEVKTRERDFDRTIFGRLIEGESVPGVALVMSSWIGLAVPLVMYVILRVLVREEETYLERRFGDEYRAYQRRVPAVLPLGWMTREDRNAST